MREWKMDNMKMMEKLQPLENCRKDTHRDKELKEKRIQMV